jgi:hypothetical protein
MDKLDMVLAGLRPAALDRLAEDGYTRNRHADLAMMAAERHLAPGARGGPVSTRRRRWPVLAGGAVAAAAAAVAVTAALPAGPVASPGRPAAGPGTSAAVPAAAVFLLASATAAARSSAATGTYWYVRERDYEPAIANSGHLKKPRKVSFGATFAATEESWTGQHRARTIVDEDLVFTFASAAGKARWVAAGRPPLSTAAGFGASTAVTSDYTMTMRAGVGRYQLSVADFQRLPVTAGGLGKLLRKWWASEPDKAGAVGFKNPGYAQYLVQWADVLLTGPARPGTRAAIYSLLAKQPGLTLTPGVTDPLGRAGVAVGDGGGDYLIIQPGTATLLAYASYPVRANSVLPRSAGLTVYEASEWARQLGVAP